MLSLQNQRHGRLIFIDGCVGLSFTNEFLRILAASKRSSLSSSSKHIAVREIVHRRLVLLAGVIHRHVQIMRALSTNRSGWAIFLQVEASMSHSFVHFRAIGSEFIALVNLINVRQAITQWFCRGIVNIRLEQWVLAIARSWAIMDWALAKLAHCDILVINQLISAWKYASSVATTSSWWLLFRSPGFSQVPRHWSCSSSWNFRAISGLCMGKRCSLILGFCLWALMSSSLFIQHVHILLFLIGRDLEHLFTCRSVVANLLIWLYTSD